jgi:hypothetical protein
MSIKNYNDTIGNRTRDLPTFNAVPQSTAPPAACPICSLLVFINDNVKNLQDHVASSCSIINYVNKYKSFDVVCGVSSRSECIIFF